MKVVAMLGGLGSQMFKYAFYIALREESGQECLIDTTSFEVVKMWNGYELEKIFGIKEDDIKNHYSQGEWDKIRSTQGVYLPAFPLRFLGRQGGKVYYYNRGIPVRYRSGNLFLRVLSNLDMRIRFRKIGVAPDKYPKDFAEQEGSAYFDEFDHRSDLYFHKYSKQVKKAFTFPEFDRLFDKGTDISNIRRNRETAERMREGNSVAFHVRRGDHMYDNGDLFERGYYKKATAHIKENTTQKQTFYLFSDDLQWCLENPEILGLEKTDDIIPVDWNNGKESFRDMQLMTYCQHNIIPISSFSWWGYYLSDVQDKIVCAPEGYWLEVENHF